MSRIARLLKAISARLIPRRLLDAYGKSQSSAWRIDRLQNEVDWLTRNQRYLLRELRRGPNQNPLSQRVEFLMQEYRVCSQAGEDGILNYIFRVIGSTNRRFVEIGVEDGKMCNTANLSMHRGWSGLLIDASEAFVAEARRYYATIGTLRPNQVCVAQSFVTAENVNGLLLEQKVSGEVDLLSIDIDGNDYWIWNAIEVINSRVVVIEYNSFLGPEKSLVQNYDPTFRHPPTGPTVNFGASLAALSRLGNDKRYSLVACSGSGVNAFFVRDDVLQAPLHKLSTEEAYHAMGPEYESWYHVEGIAPNLNEELFLKI